MIYCFDVDGTICSKEEDYHNARPYKRRIKKVNQLYDEGNQIMLFTARGARSKIDWKGFTELQLKMWGIKYHELKLGKPHYDLCIDDKSVNDRDFFKYFKKIEIEEKIDSRIKKGKNFLESNVIEDLDNNKPWGFYNTLIRNKLSTTKVIGINDELSLQSHKNREEIWYLISGSLAVYRTDMIEPINDRSKIRMISNLNEKILKPGDGIFIKKNIVHSAKNIHKGGSVIVEVSLGSADEDDITRIYDKNGRVRLEGVPDNLTINELIQFCKNRIK